MAQFNLQATGSALRAVVARRVAMALGVDVRPAPNSAPRVPRGSPLPLTRQVLKDLPPTLRQVAKEQAAQGPVMFDRLVDVGAARLYGRAALAAVSSGSSAILSGSELKAITPPDAREMVAAAAVRTLDVPEARRRALYLELGLG